MPTSYITANGQTMKFVNVKDIRDVNKVYNSSEQWMKFKIAKESYSVSICFVSISNH